MHGSNWEKLYKEVPQELLPTEYGGKAGTIKEVNGKLFFSQKKSIIFLHFYYFL
jgi:hypothetical protein